MMNFEEARKRVCNAGKQLLQEGLVARTWGNVSVRISNCEMVITPSGRKYNDLLPQDMVVVNFYTLKYEGKIKPSSELKLHAEIYKNRPHIQAVIHTHQMYASVVAASRRNVEIYDEAHQKILGANLIKTAPYALPNTKKITVETEKAIDSARAALMANHGTVCIGKDLEEVFEVARTLELACQLFIKKQSEAWK